MTDAELDAIEKRAGAATLGPWRIRRPDHDSPEGPTLVEGPYFLRAHVESPDFAHDTRPDAEFIAAARSDVPALVAEVRRLRAIASNSPPHALGCAVFFDEPGSCDCYARR